MARPPLEVADILDAHGDAFVAAHRGHLSLGQLKVMAAIRTCRTASLGGHVARWIACKPGFFLPVRVLSRLFRRLFLDRLVALHQAGRLSFFGELSGLTDPTAFAACLTPLRRAEWVVYAKRPFAGPEAVLAYLARYTHRVAISNSRLLTMDERGVIFRWKD